MLLWGQAGLRKHFLSRAGWIFAGAPSIKSAPIRPMQKNVLILTAAYGEGHNAAARGLQTALAAREGVKSSILDPFPQTYGRFYDYSRRNYLQTIDRRPWLWSWTYRQLDRTPLIHVAARLLFSLKNALRRTFDASPPDVVVSVYPVFPYLLADLYRHGRRPFKLYTVVTDSITINSVWHRSPSDLYFVPNEDTAEVMRQAGVPAEKLRVLGFPVPPRFALERPDRPAPGPGRVLFMINAGRARALPVVERLLQFENITLTVTAGRDEALAAEIRAAAERAGKKIEVLGWISNMPELIMSHHVMIGKAGGAAVQEAIAARTPMIITHVVPGQEEGNAQLLLQHGCGAVCETPEAIAGQVRQLFVDNAALWQKWHAGISGLSRPDAAIRMAETIDSEA